MNQFNHLSNNANNISNGHYLFKSNKVSKENIDINYQNQSLRRNTSRNFGKELKTNFNDYVRNTTNSNFFFKIDKHFENKANKIKNNNPSYDTNYSSNKIPRNCENKPRKHEESYINESNHRFRHYTLRARNSSNNVNKILIHETSKTNNFNSNSNKNSKNRKNSVSNNSFKNKNDKTSQEKNLKSHNTNLSNISNLHNIGINQYQAEIHSNNRSIRINTINQNKKQKSNGKISTDNDVNILTFNNKKKIDVQDDFIFTNCFEQNMYQNNEIERNDSKINNNLNNINITASLLNKVIIYNDQLSENNQKSMDIDDTREIPLFSVCNNKFTSLAPDSQYHINKTHPSNINIKDKFFFRNSNPENTNFNSIHQIPKANFWVNKLMTEDANNNLNKAHSNSQYLKKQNPFIEKIFNPFPQNVDDYIDDILINIKNLQNFCLPRSDYMKNQTDINEKMRGILIDWLVEVHLKFKLLPETLFLTVNYIDRYLSEKIILRTKLQLVGICCLFIACKYEEIYPPDLKDFVCITDKAYSKEEIIDMENDVLHILKFDLTIPSSFRYLELYNCYLKLDLNIILFCRYLLELFLLDYKMIKYNCNLLACSSLYLTFKITKNPDTDKILKLSQYSEDALRDCSVDICCILDNLERYSLQAVKKKYSLPQFNEVAKYRIF